MIKSLFLQWAIKALLAYLSENGDELLDKLVVWITQVLENLDNGEDTFAAPAPVEGAEGFCAAAMAELEQIRNEAA